MNKNLCFEGFIYFTDSIVGMFLLSEYYKQVLYFTVTILRLYIYYRCYADLHSFKHLTQQVIKQKECGRCLQTFCFILQFRICFRNIRDGLVTLSVINT